VDTRVSPPAPERVAQAVAPDFALGAHVAPLGLASAVGSRLPAPFTSGVFIGQHGSWNQRPHSGHKVVFVPFSGGQPSGPALDVLSGFLHADGGSFGRPVGVAMDARGSLLVVDDVGNVVWRVRVPQ
jgi:glucose/arabinose dehydrogenase